MGDTESAEPRVAASSTAAPRLPPPETRDEVSLRRSILASFWAIIVLIGIPLWYLTTTVPRADLPLDMMNQWAEGQVCSAPILLPHLIQTDLCQACQLKFPVCVALDAPSMAPERFQTLSALVQGELDQQRDTPLYTLHLVGGRDDASNGTRGIKASEQISATVKLSARPSEDTPSASLHMFSPVLDIFCNPSDISDHSDLTSIAHFIASEIHGLFAEERANIEHTLALSPMYDGASISQRPDSASTQEIEKRSNRAFKYAETYHLTFSLFSGSSTPSSWDIQAALEEYLQPLLDSFSSISNFTVDTQVQLYASLSPSLQGPQYDDVSHRWTLLHSDLSAFVNAAEWPLSPSIGTGPTINMVLYVPSETHAPLVIQDGGNSWLIPQWGGVQIINPQPGTSGNTTHLVKEDLEQAMHIFADQLQLLLGLPQSPPSFPLRLSSLARERTASLILSASSTLGALARLTLKLTAIAIPDNVAKSVTKTIHHLEAACQDLHQSQFSSALDNARIAEAEAEQAFFDPSMVGQVYFPDEHKVAVYVPLLGPVAVPLIMAALKEIKNMR